MACVQQNDLEYISFVKNMLTSVGRVLTTTGVGLKEHAMSIEDCLDKIDAQQDQQQFILSNKSATPLV